MEAALAEDWLVHSWTWSSLRPLQLQVRVGSHGVQNARKFYATGNSFQFEFSSIVDKKKSNKVSMQWLPGEAKNKLKELRMEDEQDKSKILEEAKKKLDTAEDKTNKLSGQGKVDDATKYKTEVVEEFKEKMEVANNSKK